MKKHVKLALVSVAAAGLVFFIVSTIASINKAPLAAVPPDPGSAPVRVYGKIEPEGGAVKMSLPGGKRVLASYVTEGDEVRPGQKLCLFENSVEEARFNTALARVEAQKKAAEISLDEFLRKKKLFDTNIVPEFDYLVSLRKKELDEINVKVAAREADFAKAQLDTLTLTSPLDGKVYRFDLRPGESYRDGDDTRILLGKPGLQVRLYVEVFWIGRLKVDGTYEVYNSETDEPLGTGRIVSQAPTLGPKRVQSEDPREREDTSFQEVVMALEPSQAFIPIGLTVVVRGAD
jgi:multidrug efflux pump subunit AcrA (membrane-fusion protein)